MTRDRLYTSPQRRPALSASAETRHPDILWNLAGGLFLRGALMFYGLWQDTTMAVKYTDIDYYVFTDAARFVTQGDSPYKRATYRYTPILAWILTPNIFLGQLFGKILFILADVAAALLIYRILKLRQCSHGTAKLCMQLWLFNPLPVAVSSRGNAESILALLVLGALYCFVKGGDRSILIGSVLYALSVHMKIYPVAYSLPLYLYLNNSYYRKIRLLQEPDSQIHVLFLLVWPNKRRFVLVTVTVAVLLVLTAVCYACYGDEFLEETYLYHIGRRDIRHNFSAYFYMLYLTAESPMAAWIGLAVFIPQVVLLLVISLRYHRDLPFCCFLQTFVFVTFNKVCTSQYFLWYLSLLPLVVPQIQQTWRQVTALTAAWFLGQALWLLPAYYLEFEGKPTFLLLWLAGLVFFGINITIMSCIIHTYNYTPVYQGGERVSLTDQHLPSAGDLATVLYSKLLGRKSKKC